MILLLFVGEEADAAEVPKARWYCLLGLMCLDGVLSCREWHDM